MQTVLNERRRNKVRVMKRYERRQQRHQGGDFKYSGYYSHPNETRYGWSDSKARR